MRLAVLTMIRTLTHNVLIEEALAQRIMDAAEAADGLGEGAKARLFRAMGRRRQVRVLELQGRLAVLNEQYAAAYHAGA